jgi:hypothetical protein
MCCSTGKYPLLDLQVDSELSQVLSGKVPWSEVREDMAVAFRLAKGHNPDRPTSRPIDDSHWNLIQDCWSQLEERPTIQTIILAIEQFSKECPQSPSLRELLAPSSSSPDADSTLANGSSSSPNQSETLVNYSNSRVGEFASDEDGEDSCVAMMIPSFLSLLLITLPFTLQHRSTFRHAEREHGPRG